MEECAMITFSSLDDVSVRLRECDYSCSSQDHKQAYRGLCHFITNKISVTDVAACDDLWSLLDEVRMQCNRGAWKCRLQAILVLLEKYDLAAGEAGVLSVFDVLLPELLDAIRFCSAPVNNKTIFFFF
jgi:hypothetical protein